VEGNLSSYNIASGRAKSDRSSWMIAILLFSMLSEGFVVPFLGRKPNLFLFDFLLPVIFLSVVCWNALDRHYTRSSDATVLYLAVAYFFAQCASLLVNYRDVLRSLVGIKVFLFGFLTYWLVMTTIRSRQGLERVADILVFWGATVGMMLLLRFVEGWSSIIGPKADYGAKQEVALSLGRNNYLAALLVPILPVAVSGAFARRGILRLVMILAAGTMAVGLLITMSKGAIVALLVGLLCAMPLLRKNGLGVRHLLVATIILIVFIMVIPTDLIATNVEMFVYRADNPDFKRLDLWKVAWREFVHNPILGIGPNCIYIYNQQYAVDTQHTHNFILNVLADLGLAGAIPFFGILMTLIRRSYKSCLVMGSNVQSRWISIGLFAGLMATLAHGLVEPTFAGAQYSVIFWVCAALICLYDPDHASRVRGGNLASRGNSSPSAGRVTLGGVG
jgi:O-antigen ligase